MRAQDAVALWQALLGEEKPPTVFVGHSMGGAIATWAASRQVGISLMPVVLGLRFIHDCAAHSTILDACRTPLLQPHMQLSWHRHPHPAHGKLGIARVRGFKKWAPA